MRSPSPLRAGRLTRNRGARGSAPASTPGRLGTRPRTVVAEFAEPVNDLFEPSAIASAAPFLADASIAVDRVENPGSQRVRVSLAAVGADPPIGARPPLTISWPGRHRAQVFRTSGARLTLSAGRANASLRLSCAQADAQGPTLSERPSSSASELGKHYPTKSRLRHSRATTMPRGCMFE